MFDSFEILYEDNHLIAVNKGVHDLVQGDNTGDVALDSMVKNYLKQKYNKPGRVYLGVTHRLDRPVSGVVLFTRTSKALTRMNELFRSGNIQKTYWAIVKNRPAKDQDTLTSYITRNTKQNKSYCSEKQTEHSKLARLEYIWLASSENYHLLEVNLLTGRHHQIRAQLASIGSPIKGDLKYGFPRSNPDGGISLHARKIAFSHPVTKDNIEIVATPPSEDKLWAYLQTNC